MCRIKNCAPFHRPARVTRLQRAGRNGGNGNCNRRRNRRRGNRNNRQRNGNRIGGNQDTVRGGNQYGHRGHRNPETVRVVLEVRLPSENRGVGVEPQVQPGTNNTRRTGCNQCRGCVRKKCKETIYHRLERIEQLLDHAIDLSVRAKQARAQRAYSPVYTPTSPPYPDEDINSDTSDSSVEEVNTCAVKQEDDN